MFRKICTAIVEGRVGQHSTSHNQQSDELYVDEMSWQSMRKIAITPYLLVLTNTDQSWGEERLKAFWSLLLVVDEMYHGVVIALNIWSVAAFLCFKAACEAVRSVGPVILHDLLPCTPDNHAKYGGSFV